MQCKVAGALIYVPVECLSGSECESLALRIDLCLGFSGMAISLRSLLELCTHSRLVCAFDLIYIADSSA